MSEPQDAENEKTPADPVDGNPENAEKIEPASQTLLDLEASGLTPEDISAAADTAAAEAEKKKNLPAKPAANLARFRWLVLLLLSAAGSLALAWSGRETQINVLLWGAAGLILLFLLISALPPSRLWPRLPTRGGLAAALFSIAIFAQTLVGPPETFFKTCPAALAWAGLLTLALLWTAAAVLRKLRRFRPLAVLAGLVLLHAALGPVSALVNHFSPGEPELTWAALNASPAFLTGALPWFLWPMAFTLGLTLPLAALLALSDQWSSLWRSGARHGGNIFLAVAWLGLMVSGFFLFSPARDKYPDIAQKIIETAPIPASLEPAPSQLPAEPPAPQAEAQPLPPAAVTPESGARPPAAAPDQAPAAPSPEATEEPPPPASADAPVSAPPPAAAETPRVTDPPDSLEAQLDELQSRNDTLQLKVNDLESQLQLLSDRLNQLERPEQTRNLTPPLPPELEAPNRPPDQPVSPPRPPAPPEKNSPERKNSYPGGSAT